MQFVLLIVITAIPAYVLGSLNGAIIASRVFYRKDIRDYGSGNPGLTNFYRVFGKGGALLVISIDTVKTVIPVVFGGWLFSYYFQMVETTVFPFGWFFSTSFFGQALAGLGTMLGHCFPLFHRFKGGKGVMTIGVIVIVIDWRLALISWGVFIIITMITRYVSLGAMLGCTAFPVSMLLLNIRGFAELLIICLCVALVIVRHIPNIKRLIKGEESKFTLKKT